MLTSEFNILETGVSCDPDTFNCCRLNCPNKLTCDPVLLFNGLEEILCMLVDVEVSVFDLPELLAFIFFLISKEGLCVVARDKVRSADDAVEAFSVFGNCSAAAVIAANPDISAYKLSMDLIHSIYQYKYR
jgi:hypothetical protein